MNKCSEVAESHFLSHKSQALRVLLDSDSAEFKRVQLQSQPGSVKSELNHQLVTWSSCLASVSSKTNLYIFSIGFVSCSSRLMYIIQPLLRVWPNLEANFGSCRNRLQKVTCPVTKQNSTITLYTALVSDLHRIDA